MIGSPNTHGDGYLALLLVDRLLSKLIDADAIDKAEVSAWVDELRQELSTGASYTAKTAALNALNAARIGS